MNNYPEFIIHRINEISKLKLIPHQYGCEVDIRSYGSNLILNHDPYLPGENLKDYLDNYHHGTLVLNIKESGIESDVLKLVRERNISSFFLLDVEFPYLYEASRKGEKNIAVRYSEEEPLKLVSNYINKVDWVWIDTITKLPIDKTVINKLNLIKTCLVCPERWGRPNDITKYKKRMNSLNFFPDAIMTSLDCINDWNK